MHGAISHKALSDARKRGRMSTGDAFRSVIIHLKRGRRSTRQSDLSTIPVVVVSSGGRGCIAAGACPPIVVVVVRVKRWKHADDVVER